MQGTLDHAARQSFSGCAPFYDALTAHHRYDDLTDILERALSEHGHPGRRMLDVACGTGKSFLEFARRGYEVTACDISPEMLATARRRAHGAARIVLADMREMPRLGSFDLLTCIDEPLNYLLEASELDAALAGFARNLRPGGLCLFDVNTLQAFRTVFARDECYEQEGWLFIWRGHGDGEMEPGGRSGFTIEAFTEPAPGHWVRHTNQHLQRHYPIAAMRAALERAGLEPLRVYGLTPDGRVHRVPDEDRQLKLIYVSRKRTGVERR